MSAAFDLHPSTTGILLIDVQERFLPAIPAIAPDQPVGRNCRILVEGARAAGAMVIASEQYPKGLGPTLPHLVAALGDAPRLAKAHFSCCGDDALAAALRDAQRSHWVLCGVEAHVCVLATAADLLAAGRHVIIAADAVDSRRPDCRDHARSAARDLGALVLPVESVLFRLLRRAQGDAFKAISALVR
jgi:nicotinamidase-related amidase